MNEVVCPICLGQSFAEFRGRERACCTSCNSLERHRLFKMFLLWLGPVRSRLVLSTVSPLEKINRFEERLKVERLHEIDVSSLTKPQALDSLVFLENLVGFREVAEDQKHRVRALMEAGAMMVFTCHSGFEEKRRTDLIDLFGRHVDCHHFDPRKVYGETVSEQFGLNLSGMRRGKGDIYFYAKEADAAHAPIRVRA